MAHVYRGSFSNALTGLALPIGGSFLFGILLISAIVLSQRRVPRRSRRRIYVMRHGHKQENTPTRDNFTTELMPEGLEVLLPSQELLLELFQRPQRCC